jgi:hypothetical protein
LITLLIFRYATAHRILHIPEPGETTGMESDVLGGPEERRLEDEEIGVLAEGFEIVIFGERLGFRWYGEDDVQVASEPAPHCRDEVVDVVLRVQLLQVDFYAVHFTAFQYVDQSLEMELNESRARWKVCDSNWFFVPQKCKRLLHGLENGCTTSNSPVIESHFKEI